MDWRISIPTQGVEIVTSDKSVIKGYFADEVAYYNRLALIDYQLQFGQTGYGTLNLTRKATEQLSKIIADIDSENTAALNAYVSAANARRVLVGKSRTGERVDEL